jgi:hypothetical protein
MCPSARGIVGLPSCILPSGQIGANGIQVKVEFFRMLAPVHAYLFNNWIILRHAVSNACLSFHPEQLFSSCLFQFPTMIPCRLLRTDSTILSEMQSRFDFCRSGTATSGNYFQKFLECAEMLGHARENASPCDFLANMA